MFQMSLLGRIENSWLKAFWIVGFCWRAQLKFVNRSGSKIWSVRIAAHARVSGRRHWRRTHFFDCFYAITWVHGLEYIMGVRCLEGWSRNHWSWLLKNVTNYNLSPIFLRIFHIVLWLFASSMGTVIAQKSHWKNISSNQLFSNFFSKYIGFTKCFLPKYSESKVP